jgi:hypothetical protein
MKLCSAMKIFPLSKSNNRNPSLHKRSKFHNISKSHCRELAALRDESAFCACGPTGTIVALIELRDFKLPSEFSEKPRWFADTN